MNAEDEWKDKMVKLVQTSGVKSQERLALLFIKKHPDVAGQLSMARIKGLANQALKTDPSKQVLQFPTSVSGGRIHASGPDDVWQADTASMFAFGKNP